MPHAKVFGNNIGYKIYLNQITDICFSCNQTFYYNNMLAHVGNIQWYLTLVYVCYTYTKLLHHYTLSSQGANRGGYYEYYGLMAGLSWVNLPSKSNMLVEIIVNMHYAVVSNQPPLEC